MARSFGLVALVCLTQIASASAQHDATATPASQTQPDWANMQKYRAANAELNSHPNARARVVFFGDSLTEHWGMTNREGVSNTGTFLADHGYVNRGISRQTTPQMLVRFRQDVLDLHPAVLVLLAGTNDIAGNTGPMSLQQTEENLETMTELARLNGISVSSARSRPRTSSGGRRNCPLGLLYSP